jgi:hypothetical protein
MHAVMNTDDGIRVVDADEPSGAGVRLSVVSAGSAAPMSASWPQASADSSMATSSPG